MPMTKHPLRRLAPSSRARTGRRPHQVHTAPLELTRCATYGRRAPTRPPTAARTVARTARVAALQCAWQCVGSRANRAGLPPRLLRSAPWCASTRPYVRGLSIPPLLRGHTAAERQPPIPLPWWVHYQHYVPNSLRPWSHHHHHHHHHHAPFPFHSFNIAIK